jgi:hypothetical protein
MKPLACSGLFFDDPCGRNGSNVGRQACVDGLSRQSKTDVSALKCSFRYDSASRHRQLEGAVRYVPILLQNLFSVTNEIS